MKLGFKSGILLCFCVLFAAFGCGDTPTSNEEEEEETHSLELISYNIRGDQEEDGNNRWEFRRDRVAGLIKKYNPAVIGLQEARPIQFDYLKGELEDFQALGGGTRAGEYTVFLYNTKMVEYVEDSFSFIWLSETPNQQSVGWDARFVRILIYARFKDIETGDHLFVFNTHFDHQGDTAREESAKLVAATIQELADNERGVLMGDFNFTEDSIPYYTLTSSDTGLKNAFYESETPHVGPVTRAAGFSVANHSDEKPIDFIFINDKVKVLKHAFLIDSRNGYYPSDHLPVLAEIEFE